MTAWGRVLVGHIALFLCFGCGLKEVLGPSDSVGRQLQLDKKWVRDTLIQQQPGYRRQNRMTPLMVDQLVIQGNAADAISAYYRHSGHRVWQLPVDQGVEGGADSFDNQIYFVTNAGYVYAHDVLQNKRVWSYPIKFEGLARPFATKDMVYVLSGNNVLHAIDRKTGLQKWLYNRPESTPISVRGGSRPSVEGSTIYVGFSDGYLVALNRQSGQVRWERRLNNDRRFQDIDSSPVIDGNRLYVSSFDDALYCINRETGEVIWRADGGGVSTVTIDGDRIYYSTSQGQVIALDKSSGKRIWTYELARGYATKPSVYKGLIVVGESQGGLRLLDSQSGQSLKSYQTGLGVVSDPLVDVKTGDVFVVSQDANLYAFRISWRSKRQSWP